MVEKLQYSVSEYQKFVWHIYQTVAEEEKEIIQTIYKPKSEDEFTSFRFTFEAGLLGENWFSPGCTYSVELECYYNGTGYSLPRVSFSTDPIEPPNVDSINPKVYPFLKHQEIPDGEGWTEAGNCVAQSISTAMEIFQYSATGKSEQYSISYIFGADGRTKDDMFFEEAVELAKSHGSPRWELAYGDYPDNLSKAASVDLFNNSDALTNTNALNQAFTGYENVDFYDTEAVASYISEHGYFMMNFRIPENFYNLMYGGDGIVPQPDTYSGENHSIALIGLTVKNGKKHWIAQNSWGRYWGDGGRCYIPYDWGSGVLAPTDAANDGSSSWTMDCYAVWNDKELKANTYRPKITGAVQVGNQKLIRVSWSGDEFNDTYIVYARKEYTDVWHKKTIVLDTEAIVEVEEYGDYEIMIIGLSGAERLCSPQSKVAEVKVYEEKTRPNNFSWIRTKLPGINFVLTANEWNLLCDRIIEFLSYTEKVNSRIGNNDLGLPQETTLYEIVQKLKADTEKGKPFRAYSFNLARAVIEAVSQKSTAIPKKNKYDEIYAEMLNRIVEVLNDTQ